jgi:AcrR family transcriptional regulator
VSRQRLIEAAEQLFAGQGIAGPSLAEVTRAAGLGNTGAVHHYFGGREELVAAIVDQHRADMDAQRERMLDEIEASGDTSIELLVRLLVEPMVAKLDDERGRAFLAIQAERSLRPRRPRDERRPIAVRILRLLDLPDRPGPGFDLIVGMGLDLARVSLAQRALQEAVGGRDVGIGRERYVHHLTGAVARVARPGDPAAWTSS